MKMHLVLVSALLFVFSTSAISADKAAAPAKKAPAKKAVKKVPPSEPEATTATTPTPTPAPETAQPVEITPAPTQETAPAATTTAATETPPATDTEGYGKTEGLLGKFLVGPNVTLLGFPTPFRFGLETKWDNLLGLSFDYGFFPSLTVSDVSVKYNSWRLAARVFPWKAGFYLGLGFGKQNFTGATSKTTAGTAVAYNLTVDTTILVPQIGWRWTSQSGFFFGMELGVQLASSSTATFSSDAPAAIQGTAEYAANKADIEDAGKTFGQTTLPHMALVQLGWFL